MDTQEILLLAFLLERVRDEVLVIPWLLPIPVPVGSPFLYVVIRNREEIHGVRDKIIVLLCSVSQEVPARAIDDADVPVDQHTLHCVLVPHQVVHTIRRFQLHESFALILG